MKSMLCFTLGCLAMWCMASQMSAADAGLATAGKTLFEDDFARTDLTPKWRVGKGFFTVKDGVVNAAENPEDKHGAYAYVTPNFLYKDIVAEFSVQLAGSRVCSLMINDNKYKESHAGHILRIGISMGKIDLADWKYGSMKNDIFEKMKDPNTTADEKTKLRESIKDKSASFKVADDFAQWHQIKVEIVGDEMLVSVDGKPEAYLKSQGVDHATKNAIGFEVGGKSSNIKSMKVSEATASSDWSTRRDAVVAALKK